jgi:hypothetical protein
MMAHHPVPMMYEIRSLLRLAMICSCWASVACTTTTASLRARYAKERRCPESQVAVREEGGAVYRAEGCGGEAEYYCESFAGPGDPSKQCRERGLNPREPSGEPPPKNPRQDLVSPK